MRFFTFLLLLSVYSLSGQDTFSIIAADPVTGEIGAAGATCVDGIADFGGIQILNTIIPGRGGVNAQASICINPHINLVNAVEQIEQGQSPQEIIDWLVENDACFANDFDPTFRQYGIVDFSPEGEIRTIAYTGENASDYKGDLTGPTYAIQGNILLGPEVLEGMEENFNNTTGSLAERLMAAMQGANIPGADSRCLSRGTSSTSAFLRVVRPTDDPAEPYLELNVLESPFGEEPIDSLQVLFDEWALLNNTEDVPQEDELRIYPNPSAGLYTIALGAETTVQQVHITNSAGQRVWQLQTDDVRNLEVNLTTKPAGLYWLTVQLDSGQQLTRKLVKY